MPAPLGTPVVSVSQMRARRRGAHQRHLDVVGEQRREHEQAPHAVDDRGDAGQQLDRRADRPAQERRAELDQEEGHPAGHRQGEEQRQRRR